MKHPGRSSGHTKIPNALLDRTDLSSTEKLLLAGLKSYAYNHKITCDPSLASLAAIASIKRRQTIVLLAKLERNGFISTSKRNGARTEYTLLFMQRPPRISTKPVHSSAPLPVHPTAPEEEKKERKIQNRVSTRDVNALINQFAGAHQIHTLTPYVPQSSDTRAARAILKLYPISVITPLIPAFFANPDPRTQINPTFPAFTHYIEHTIDLSTRTGAFECTTPLTTESCALPPSAPPEQRKHPMSLD